VQGDYAYITGGSFKILNIANPAVPVESGSLAIPVSSVTISGDYAVCAGGSNGLYVVDVTNPYMPVLSGYYDTPGQAYKTAVQGNLVYLADYYNFGVYDCSAAMTTTISLSLTPYHTPIVIASGGGEFAYNLAVVNNSDSLMTCDLWVNVEVPGGFQFTILGPVLGLTLGAGDTIECDRTVFVPGRARAGEYMCWSYIGTYPWTVIDTDAFSFVKAGAEGICESSEGWISAGEPLPGEAAFTEKGVPKECVLLGISPNPFNQSTVVSYQLPIDSWVDLRIYDITGREAAKLVDEMMPAGIHRAVFEAEGLSSGVYFVRLAADGGWQMVRKSVVMK